MRLSYGTWTTEPALRTPRDFTRRIGAANALQFDAACVRCERLAAFLADCRATRSEYYGLPVPPFGDEAPNLLIVGLAPGYHGANRTGRPFTGDFAGTLLYDTLHRLGAATQASSIAADDALRLRGVRISNSVKCVPPQNKPTPSEVRNCNGYLRAELLALSGSARALLALGRVAHDATLLALGLKASHSRFAHGAEHLLPDGRWLVDSYHCSRYNTQTRRLTPKMFEAVVARALELARGGAVG